MTRLTRWDLLDQPHEIELARQFYGVVLARGTDLLTALDQHLAQALRRSFFSVTCAGRASENPVGLLGVHRPWRATRNGGGWRLDGYWNPRDRAGNNDHRVVIAEADGAHAVAIVRLADADTADSDQVRLFVPPSRCVIPPARQLSEHLGRHELFAAVLAIETARDYLIHVIRWLGDRTSFGHRMIENPVLKQRLVWAVVALRAADEAFSQPGMGLNTRCAIAVSSAVDCVRRCEAVHAGAGVFDIRPQAVHAIGLRHHQDHESTLREGAPPLGDQRPELTDRLHAVLAASLPSPRVLLAGPATIAARRLIRALEDVCPVEAATLLDELIVAESLAQTLPPGLTARVLVHRLVVRCYLSGADAALASADLLAGARTGRLLTAIAVTERQGGSDLSSLAADVRAGDLGLVLKAVKTYVTGGADCDAVLVAAKRGADLVLAWVDTHRPGVNRRLLESRAWRGAQLAELQIGSYELSARDLHRGSGTAVLLAGLTRERMVVAAQQLSYARRWIANLTPGSSAGLVNRLCAAQALLQSALVNAGPGEPSIVDASTAKAVCSAVAAEVADARAHGAGETHDERWLEELMDDQASARAAMCAGGTADLNLAIVEGTIMSILGRNGGGVSVRPAS